jgi:hypothetical protein
VYYTARQENPVVARYRLSASPDRADPSSEEVILRVTQPFANHNGGQLAFGPDGFLSIGMGDGGSGGDPNNYAQNLSVLPGNQRLLGKLLRVDTQVGEYPLLDSTLHSILQIHTSRQRDRWRKATALFPHERVGSILCLAESIDIPMR